MTTKYTITVFICILLISCKSTSKMQSTSSSSAVVHETKEITQGFTLDEILGLMEVSIDSVDLWTFSLMDYADGHSETALRTGSEHPSASVHGSSSEHHAESATPHNNTSSINHISLKGIRLQSKIKESLAHTSMTSTEASDSVGEETQRQKESKPGKPVSNFFVPLLLAIIIVSILLLTYIVKIKR